MKIKGLRWVIVSLVALATIINYIDRGALAVLWPEISGELGLSKTDYAIIINVFTFAYAFGQSLFGKIFDWIGTRLGFVLAIGVWSLATVAVFSKPFSFEGKKRSLTRYTYDLTDRHRGFGQLLDKKATLREIVETNINLGRLPETGFKFFAVPEPVKGMGSFPVRAFALIH